MFTVVAPIPNDLADSIQPFRETYDPSTALIPAHICVLTPFHYPESSTLLLEHLADIGETHAPIKVSLVGWDIQQQGGSYHLRLPIIAGQQEFVALRDNLLGGPLSGLEQQRAAYWPHIPFGQVSTQAAADAARDALQQFIPKYIFRVTHLLLFQQTTAQAPWQLQRKIGLEATVASSRRRTKTPAPLRLDQNTKR